MSEVAIRNPAQELVGRVRQPAFRDQVKLALPESVSADRFTRVAITALQQNPEIAECDPDTIFAALLRAAADGLLPDGREAALVTFNTKDKRTDTWVKKAQYMPMIGGFRKIAAEHGWTIRTDVVYANDTFEYELGERPRLEHRPARLDQERGDPIGAYAVGTHTDGRRQVEVLRKQDIEKARSVSRASDKGPWVEWPERMWEKTAGRRLFAKLPLGEREADRMVRVIEASELEPGDAAEMLYGPRAGQAHPVRELSEGSRGGGDHGNGEPAPGAQDAESAQPAPTAASAGEPSGSPLIRPADSAEDVAAGAAEPSPADEPEEPPEPGSNDEPDPVAEARAVMLPQKQKGTDSKLRYSGKTIGEVEDKDPGYLDWILKVKAERWDSRFRGSVQIVVAARKQA